MPAKPSWIERLPALKAFPDEYVDRATVECALGIERRRALQLMAGLPGKTIGSSKVVERGPLLKRLRSIAAGEDSAFESERRARFAIKLDAMRQERIEQPRVPVVAPIAVMDSRISQLPAGVSLEPGRIAVSFDTVTEACERLLALAMAIGNDPVQFEELVSKG